MVSARMTHHFFSEADPEQPVTTAADVLDLLLAKRQTELQEELEHEISRAKRYGTVFSMLLTKVQAIRKTASSRGEHAAALIVMEVRELLRTNLRISDKSFRYSDSDYIILLPNTTREGATVAGRRLKHVIEKQLMGGHRQPEATVSFAVAAFPLAEWEEAR